MGESIKDWIPLINKLVWPAFSVVLLLLFHGQVREVYRVVLDGVKSGRGLEIAGILKLGEAARNTEISELSFNNISIEGIGGPGGVVRKGSEASLMRLQEELRESPSRTIDTLLVTDGIMYSVELLKQYVSTLGLRFVVFQRGNQFDGWMNSGTFVAQLLLSEEFIRYEDLKDSMIGVSQENVQQTDSAKEVLEKMQELHIDSIPVLESSGRWRFFANRGEILARLMSSVLLEE